MCPRCSITHSSAGERDWHHNYLCVAQEVQHELCVVLSRMHKGARTLTYHDIRKMWTSEHFPFKQFEVNRHLTDRFPTSWSVQRGHHFLLWKKVRDR